MDALTEALLVFAARRDHLQQVIGPGAGARHLGAVRTVSPTPPSPTKAPAAASTLPCSASWNTGCSRGRQPDLTLWFDAPAATAASRRAAVREPDRFEAQDEAFFHRVSAGYAARAAADARRFVRIDASRDRDAVWQQVQAALQMRWPGQTAA